MTVETRPNASSEMLTGLWQAYRAGGDLRIRDRLILTLSPLVSFAGLDGRDDAVVSQAFAALIAAIERWDPARDGALEQFAWGELSRLAAGSLATA